MEPETEQTITVSKAGPVSGRYLPDITIRLEGEPPDLNGLDWAAAYDRFYRGEASRLAEALVRSLPGGTLDRLLVCLLDHKASLLRVPMSREPDADQATTPWLTPQHRGWSRAWGEIARLFGDASCAHEGETWQYMGSFETAVGVVHEFRHRALPPRGERHIARVPADPADYQPLEAASAGSGP